MINSALIGLERKVSNYADNQLGRNCGFDRINCWDDMGLLRRNPSKVSMRDLR